MVISPEKLEKERKLLEKDTHNQLVREFDKWLADWLMLMDAVAYPLPYRISWMKCFTAISDMNNRSPMHVFISGHAVIREVLCEYKKNGWKIVRDDRKKGWWIFKKRVDEIVFDKLD